MVHPLGNAPPEEPLQRNTDKLKSHMCTHACDKWDDGYGGTDVRVVLLTLVGVKRMGAEV